MSQFTCICSVRCDELDPNICYYRHSSFITSFEHAFFTVNITLTRCAWNNLLKCLGQYQNSVFSINLVKCRSTVKTGNLSLNYFILKKTWWRHQMETFSALLALCAGNSPVTGEFPAQRPVTRSFDVLFDLRLNKRLNKQSLGWWFETPSASLWHQCNRGRRLPSPSW